MIYDISLVPGVKVGPIMTNRRQLLASTGLGALGLTLALGAGSALVTPALAATKVTDEQKATLLRMAKDIYPHDGFLDDKPYEDVVNGIVDGANKGGADADLVNAGLADLDDRANKLHGSNYLGIKSEFAREALLRTIETTDFFQKVRGGLLFGLYNNQALWPKFGYEGSSWEQGGYIDRGFSDATWVPPGPDAAARAAAAKKG
ncbi:MAG: hypothetical protein ACRBCJ_13810 [Hyphomicrobiaceae bacterium]